MAGGRVVQDSDESDAEISDAATSIDPLQDDMSSDRTGAQPPDGHHSASQSNDPQAHANRSIDDEDTGGTVNFDSFLLSRSYDGEQFATLQHERQEPSEGVADRSMSNVGKLQLAPTPETHQGRCYMY
jgi:hypothetical protein